MRHAAAKRDTACSFGAVDRSWGIAEGAARAVVKSAARVVMAADNDAPAVTVSWPHWSGADAAKSEDAGSNPAVGPLPRPESPSVTQAWI